MVLHQNPPEAKSVTLIVVAAPSFLKVWNKFITVIRCKEEKGCYLTNTRYGSLKIGVSKMSDPLT
jgi:hypothetical protein